MKDLRLYLSIFIIFLSFNIYADDNIKNKLINDKTINKIKVYLINKYGNGELTRINYGVNQTAGFWQLKDGSKQDFINFCQNNFLIGKELDQLFNKIEMYSEVLNGHFRDMTVDLYRPVSLDWGEIHKIDKIFSQYEPESHLIEDLFNNKIAFYITLNFPNYPLKYVTKNSDKWSRKQWAYARAGIKFNSRIPSDKLQESNKLQSNGEMYISNYKFHMNNLIDNKKKSLFKNGKILLSHWGLRDEIKTLYSDKKSLNKQTMIYKIMEHIINQSVPKKVINSTDYKWNPFNNTVYKNNKPITLKNEQNERYQHLINSFKAKQMLDKYFPHYPNYITRRFELINEIPLKNIEEIFDNFMKSNNSSKIAKLIKNRLNRDLKPWDIWYTGFRTSADISEKELTKSVSNKYPTLKSFKNNIPIILKEFGFSAENAEFIASYIQVDPARGGGHCAGSDAKKFKSRIRTPALKGQLSYMGFNTAMHELGHAVEQVLTLHKADYYSLRGVPGSPFTEAFAFIFESYDNSILGFNSNVDSQNAEYIIDAYWSVYEIMGVSMVELKTWKWLYKNPQATPLQLKRAVIKFSKEVWNKYFAAVFGTKDEIILGIYSHMITYPLYLSNYAIGNIIQFQIQSYLEGKNLGTEMERMCLSGKIAPQKWMKKSVGREISIEPLLLATEKALNQLLQ